MTTRTTTTPDSLEEPLKDGVELPDFAAGGAHASSGALVSTSNAGHEPSPVALPIELGSLATAMYVPSASPVVAVTCHLCSLTVAVNDITTAPPGPEPS